MEDIINSIMDEKKSTSENNIILNTEEEYIKEWDIIAFTDGSCIGKRQGAKFGGSGVYLHSTKESKYSGIKILKKQIGETILYLSTKENKIVSEYNNIENFIHICDDENCNKVSYTHDNKCSKHKKENSIVVAKYFTYNPTNIRAEGFAILFALRSVISIFKNNFTKKIKRSILKTDINNEIQNIKNIDIDRLNLFNYDNVIMKSDFHNYTGKKVMIVSDSLFWIDLITKWLSNWISKRSVEERKNIDIILLILNALKDCKENNIYIFFQHIEGHKDKKGGDVNIYHKGNIIADKLATHASSNEENNLIVI